MEQDLLVEIKDLDFSFQNTPVLEDVSLCVRKGEFVGFFGPNGGGKTTLLKLIMGLLTPTKGSIALKRLRIGYVPQHVRFDRAFPISVEEVVLQGCLSRLTWWGSYPADAKTRANEALTRVGLHHKANAPFGTLSGGEAQRAFIARAIVDNPELLLLDEPTSNVDTKAEQLIYQLLLELNQTMTILMVSHDLQMILDKVKRFVCVHRRVTNFETKQLCEHFALGLYHAPLTSSQHFTF